MCWIMIITRFVLDYDCGLAARSSSQQIFSTS
jgi:hypothetical protein